MNERALVAHANARLQLADHLHQYAVGAFGPHERDKQIRYMRAGIKAREIAIRTMQKIKSTR